MSKKVERRENFREGTNSEIERERVKREGKRVREKERERYSERKREGDAKEVSKREGSEICLLS